MDFLQTIDFANPLWIALGCTSLCIIGVIVSFVLPIIGSILGIFIGIFEMFLGIFELGFGAISAGPIGCFGCLLTSILCGSCGAITLALVWVAPRCGTPEALNICRFLGS